jgi:hypothetical protein
MNVIVHFEGKKVQAFSIMDSFAGMIEPGLSRNREK